MSALLVVVALLAAAPNGNRADVLGAAKNNAPLMQPAAGRMGQHGAGVSSAVTPDASQRDAGDELVELIQTTIAPTSWERMGGPGTIRYWRPRKAVAARANQNVHDQMSDLLEQMGRLGR